MASGHGRQLDRGRMKACGRDGANEYERPEDVETDTSTGRDVNNNGETVYIAITGTVKCWRSSNGTRLSPSS